MLRKQTQPEWRRVPEKSETLNNMYPRLFPPKQQPQPVVWEGFDMENHITVCVCLCARTEAHK